MMNTVLLKLTRKHSGVCCCSSFYPGDFLLQYSPGLQSNTAALVCSQLYQFQFLLSVKLLSSSIRVSISEKQRENCIIKNPDVIFCDSSQNIFLLLLSQTSLSQIGRNSSIMGMVLCPWGDLPDHFVQMATFLTALLS